MKTSTILCAGLLWLCTFFLSCYTAKKANKQVSRALTEYPVEAARQIRDKFPCIKQGIDSAEYIQSMLEADSIVNALGAKLDSASNIHRPFNIDSVSAENCAELLTQVNDYNKQLESTNETLSNSLAVLKNKLANIKPVKEHVKDSADCTVKDAELAAAKQTALEKTAQYEAEKNLRVEAQSRVKGKVLIPWWVLALAGLILVIAVVLKLKK